LHLNRVQHSLTGLSGEAQGKNFSIETELIIGRSTSCDVFIPDRRMSRRHARFYAEGSHLFVEDLESHNGTFVNGKRVARMQLFRGDVVRVGTSQFEITVDTGEDSAQVEFTGDRPTAHIVKPISGQSGPSLERMPADEYFEAIGASKSDEHRAPSVNQVDFRVQQTRNFAVLFEISKVLQFGDDPIEGMARALDVVLKVIKADRGFIATLDSEGHPVPLVVRVRDSDKTDSNQRVKMSETVAEQVLGDRCGVITSDAATDARFASAESVVLNDIHSLMAVPILVGQEVRGLLEIESNSILSTFRENDLDLLSVVASTVGVAMQNYTLQKQREETIQELRAAQEQLLSAQDRLIKNEQMAAIGRVASGIAHEVKNHLSPFILADMIAKSYPDDEDIQESVELMLEAQRRILGLVDEIRHFAGGSPKRFDVNPHDVVRVLEGVIRFVKCDARIKSKVTTLEALDRPLVDMDANRMRQVFINLIRNAADATGTDGRIEIRVREQGGQLLIDFADNGAGIPQEVADQLFEPFFTTKGEKGLGLGLDISRNIVAAHNGTLTFDTRVGEGTTFRIAMPLEYLGPEVPERHSTPPS